MNYDPQTFSRYKREHRRYHAQPVGSDEQPSTNGLEKAGAEPIKFLAAGILIRAGNDYRQARKRPRANGWIANLLGYPTLMDELMDYFRGDEFLVHCAICGVDPRRYFIRFEIDTGAKR